MTIRLFAVCRERAGKDTVCLDLPSDSIPLSEVLAALVEAEPALEPLIGHTRVALNQEFAGPEARVSAGDELALIPPVSGGSGQGPFALRDTPIELAEVERAVRSDGAGAVCTFSGTVRNRTGDHEVEGLVYEAYTEMAERFLRKIGDEIAERWPGARTAILHRVGALDIGEVSVVIAVSSPHRVAAFEACRYAIERIKEDVPIWKKEQRRDGTVWVGMGS